MPTFDPFAFDPEGPFDWLHAYFMLTWMRVQYETSEGYADDATLSGLMGASSHEIIPPLIHPFFRIPRIDVVRIPPDKGVVLIRGTTSLDPEIINEVIDAGLGSHDPWPGRQSNYFADITAACRGRIAGELPARFVSAGHSLGGALAGLFSIYGAEKTFTAAQPREGDGTYAAARAAAASKLRLTAVNDPVTLIPLSSASILDELPLDVPFFALAVAYRHWGTRRHVWPDGTFTMPPQADMSAPIDAGSFFAALALNGFAAHYPDNYANCIRHAIPVKFPVGTPDADFPNLNTLDEINRRINNIEGKTWHIDGRGGIPPVVFTPVNLQEPPDFFTFVCE